MTPSLTDLLATLVMYSLCLWFGFFLLNYAAITERPAAWLKRVMGPKWGYPLGCALCFAFWMTLAAWVINWVPFFFVLAAPVLHLFIDAAYDRLGTPPVIK